MNAHELVLEKSLRVILKILKFLRNLTLHNTLSLHSIRDEMEQRKAEINFLLLLNSKSNALKCNDNRTLWNCMDSKHKILTKVCILYVCIVCYISCSSIFLIIFKLK